MGKPVLRLAFVHFRGDPIPDHPLAEFAGLLDGEDGVAVYALKGTASDEHWPDGLPLTQAFARDPPAGRSHRIVWRWDGDRAAPSLEPSYAWNQGRPNARHPYVHLYLRRGRVEELEGQVDVEQA